MVNDSEKVCEGTVSNTCLLNTTKSAQNVVVDYVSVTFKKFVKVEEVLEVFSLDVNDFEFRDYGGKRYRKSAAFQHILVFYDGANENMGVHIQMKGQGCRQYENLFDERFSWHGVFENIKRTEYFNITRLDLAIDDYEELINIPRINRLMDRGCVLCPRVANGVQHKTVRLADGKNAGSTFEIGSKAWRLRFYEKKHERQNKGFEVTVNSWNRYEVQFNKDTAGQIMDYLLEGVPIGVALKEFLNTVISFRVKSRTDKNRSRWKVQPFWTSFLEEVGKFEFIKKEQEHSVERSARWFQKQVAPTYVTLLNSIDPLLFETYMKRIGEERQNGEREKMIETFKADDEAVRAIEKHMKDYLDINTSQEIVDNRIKISDYIEKQKQERKDMLNEMYEERKAEMYKMEMEEKKNMQKKTIAVNDSQLKLYENVFDTYA